MVNRQQQKILALILKELKDLGKTKKNHLQKNLNKNQHSFTDKNLHSSFLKYYYILIR